MKKTPIVCEDVIPAFPPYPVAVRAGELLFVSGLRPDGPAGFADLPEAGREQMQGYPLADLTEGRVVADSWAVHDSLEKVLHAAGTPSDQVLRQHIWQRDKRYFPSYEHVRVHWQPTPAPSSGLGVTDVIGRGRHWIGIDAIAACIQPRRRVRRAPGDDRRLRRRPARGLTLLSGNTLGSVRLLRRAHPDQDGRNRKAAGQLL